MKSEVTLVGGQVVYNVHDETRCRNQFCTIHNPSLHHMRTWRQVWDGMDMSRMCSHNVAHPDPDDWRGLCACACACCVWTPAKAAGEILGLWTPDDGKGLPLLSPVLPSQGADLLRPIDP